MGSLSPVHDAAAADATEPRTSLILAAALEYSRLRIELCPQQQACAFFICFLGELSMLHCLPALAVANLDPCSSVVRHRVLAAGRAALCQTGSDERPRPACRLRPSGSAQPASAPAGPQAPAGVLHAFCAPCSQHRPDQLQACCSQSRRSPRPAGLPELTAALASGLLSVHHQQPTHLCSSSRH